MSETVKLADRLIFVVDMQNDFITGSLPVVRHAHEDLYTFCHLVLAEYCRLCNLRYDLFKPWLSEMKERIAKNEFDTLLEPVICSTVISSIKEFESKNVTIPGVIVTVPNNLDALVASFARTNLPSIVDNITMIVGAASYPSGPMTTDVYVDEKTGEIISKDNPRELHQHVIFTVDTHTREDYETTEEFNKLPIYHCLRNTPGWLIVPQLQQFLIEDYAQKALDPNENVIDSDFDVEKFSHIFAKSSFGLINLPESLDKYIKEAKPTIELCGVCTDVCVISNALYLRSRYPELKITVHSSACAGSSIDNHHSALNVMKVNCIDIF